MRKWQSAAIVVLAWAVAGAAQAFTIKTESENPLLTADALTAATQQMATTVGNNIPDSPDVKVYVYSKVSASKQGDGRYIFLHRIELRRAFNAGPPYPYAGWLPIESRERYGVGSADEVRAKLDEALRDFFTHMKQVDPVKGFK